MPILPCFDPLLPYKFKKFFGGCCNVCFARLRRWRLLTARLL